MAYAITKKRDSYMPCEAMALSPKSEYRVRVHPEHFPLHFIIIFDILNFPYMQDKREHFCSPVAIT